MVRNDCRFLVKKKKKKNWFNLEVNGIVGK